MVENLVFNKTDFNINYDYQFFSSLKIPFNENQIIFKKSNIFLKVKMMKYIY